MFVLICCNSTDGMLYSGCVPVSLGLKITEVALGKEHNVALTADGVVLTWGSGMYVQSQY